ncbi:lysine-specific demethylase 5-like [Dermatophagoides pteronyssinus]|uniref:lysine-specific demethylase 5-like n=1 Tax=Dermatophagoides pteronyssinus TaxID=6956 RepID=UPI003F6770D8
MATINMNNQQQLSESNDNGDNNQNVKEQQQQQQPQQPPPEIDYEKLRSFQFEHPPECPIFCPTYDEFCLGPIDYISKIRSNAEPFGICKIIPPKEFQVPFAIDRNEFHFTPRTQRINDLEAGSRIRLNFTDKLCKFWNLQGITLRIPTIEKKYLDVYRLHSVVKDEGGFEICTRIRKWGKIAQRIGYQKHNSTSLRTYYERYLYPYDIFLSGATTNPEVWKQLQEQDDNDDEPKVKQPKNISSCNDSNAPLIKKDDNGNDNNHVDLLSLNEQMMIMKKNPMDSKSSINNNHNNGHDSNDIEKKSLANSHNDLNGKNVKKEDQNQEIVDEKINGNDDGDDADDDEEEEENKFCFNCYDNYQSYSLLTCHKCKNSFHKTCLIPPFNDIPKGQWHCHSCLSTILERVTKTYTNEFGFTQSPKTYTLKEFGKMADKFKENYFRCSPPTKVKCSDLEKEFWRIVSTPFENVVCVEYGADLYTNDYGSGFPTTKNISSIPDDKKCYIKSPWNLNNLPTLYGSVFEHINTNINGMIIPWMYVGMCFSAFCWHNEDHWTYSINYLHWGEPKSWYGVPGNKAEIFESAMQKLAPDLFSSQPDLLHHLVTTCNPNLLMKLGVPIYRTDQRAGEFVVTFPRSYHAGFNQGFNFAEAVNFATADWLPTGRLSISHYSTFHRYPVFSHDELICKMADGCKDLNQCLALATYDDLKEMIKNEMHLRHKIFTIGVMNTEYFSFETFKDDERQCDYCKTTCFLSAIKCNCKHDDGNLRLVCVNHYDNLCQKCPLENLILLYRYRMDELKIMERELYRYIKQLQ